MSRLEEIKSDWEVERVIKPENVGYLIERVEELEEENYQLYRKHDELRKDAKDWYKIASRLQEENGGFEQALEFYAVSGQGIGESKHGEVARQALREGELE